MPDVALILGGDSGLGRQTKLSFLAAGFDVWVTSRRPDHMNQEKTLLLDFADEATPKEVRRLNPKVVVFNAAMTNQGKCRMQPELAKQINVLSVVRMAGEFISRGSKVIFISSSAVFDGSMPNTPANKPATASSVYGLHKSEAELGLQAISKDICIVRFSKLSHSLEPLLGKWAYSLANGDVITPFSDAFVAPIRTRLAAECVTHAVTHNLIGVVQLSAVKDISYSQLAMSFAKFFGFRRNLVVPTESARTKITPFPRHTTLDSSGFVNCNISRPEPLECLRDFRKLVQAALATSSIN